MSADLFAEFASFSGTPQQQQQQQQQTTGTPNPQAQQPVNDPFSFLSPTTSQQPAQTPAPWPSFQTQPSSGFQGNSWTDVAGSHTAPAAQAKTTSTAEDDDGWGDFEIASPVSQEQVPSQPVAAPANMPAPSSFDHLYKSTASSQPPPQPPAIQRTRVVRASTMDLMTNSLVDMGPSPGPRVQAAPAPPVWEQKHVARSRPKNTDPNVLFDADDFELGGADDDDDDNEEDDFGDFETGTSSNATGAAAPPPAPPVDLMSSDWSSSLSSKPAPKTQPPSQLLSTLSLDNTSFNQYPQAPKSPGFQERNPFPGLAVTTPKAEQFPVPAKPKSPSPVTVWPSVEQKADVAGKDDWGADWAAFDDPASQKGQKTTPAKQDLGWEWDALDAGAQSQMSTSTRLQQKAKPAPKPPAEATEPASDWGWDEADEPPAASGPAAAPNSSSVPDDTPPPTNVPPPSILLSIFPSLFDLLDSAIFEPTSAQPAAVRNRVLASPETAAFLAAYVLLAAVAARVLAGRKLRWHRDRFLAQSMSISAAGGRGGGGMKLAGVDRAQAAREDREAADVVAAWRRHVGRLRSAVATAKSAAAESSSSSVSSLRVPEVAETLPVQTAKMVPTAAKACVVCGLKREERVKGVDFEVEDSFGEWWVEHWGHRACRNFWLEHEVQLRSR